MAFKTVGGASNYFKYSQCTPGQTLIDNGTFKKTREGKFGAEHVFENADGTTTVLNKSGHLDYLLSEHVRPGMKCNVEYLGKVTLKSGAFAGKEAHNFKLQVDTDGQAVTHSESPTLPKTFEPSDTADISL